MARLNWLKCEQHTRSARCERRTSELVVMSPAQKKKIVFFNIRYHGKQNRRHHALLGKKAIRPYNPRLKADSGWCSRAVRHHFSVASMLLKAGLHGLNHAAGPCAYMLKSVVYAGPAGRLCTSLKSVP
jgi:hypothetical protein